MIENAPGNLRLRARRQGMAPSSIKKHNTGLILADRLLYEIPNYHEQPLRAPFSFGIFIERLALGSKADTRRPTRKLGDLGKDIGVFHK